jgi:20S proteasome subunit beta 4
METVLGVAGKDFVVIAADMTVARSIMRLKDNEDKLVQLDSHKLLGSSGPAADRVTFAELMQRNIQLYSFKNGIELDISSTANFLR